MLLEQCLLTPWILSLFKNANEELIMSHFVNSDYEFFWSIWDAHVTAMAKHCGKCNKCISGFDHHWFWLNNCIGEKNYKTFFKLLIALISQNLIFWFTIVINMIFNTDWDDNVKDVLRIKSKTTLIIINCVMVLLNLIELFVAGKLILFHIYIKWKGISTFEYIKNKKDKNYKSRFKIRRDSFEVRSGEGPSEVEKST